MELSKKQEYLIIAGLLILIFPFFALLFYVHPQSDDFFFAYKMQSQSAFSFVEEMYFNWSGRYFSMMLGAIDPIRLNSIVIFRLILLLFNLIFISSIFLLIRSIIKSSVSSLRIFIYTLIINLVFINGLPDVYEQIYWFPSVSSYQFGLSLFMLFLATYFFKKRKQISTTIFVIINSILSIAIIGLIELFVFPMLFVGFSFILRQACNKCNYKAEIIVFVMIITASLITLLAPGNYIRMSDTSILEKLITGINLSAKSVVFIIGYFFQNPTFIISSILLFVFINQQINKYRLLTIQLPKIHPLIVLLSSIVIIFLLFFPACFSLRYIPPGRVFNFSGFFLILIWIIDILLISNYYSKTRIPKLPKIYTRILIFVAISFLFSGLFVTDEHKFSVGDKSSIYRNGNILDAYFVLFFEAKNFDKCVSNRNRIYSEALLNQERTLLIKPLQYHPKILWHIDFNDDNYQNIWYSSWELKSYHIDSIYIEKD